MLRFKQYLIEGSGHNGISNQIQNILDLVGLDANTKKNLTDLHTELDSVHRSREQEHGLDAASRARQSRYAEQMRDIEAKVRDIGESDPIRNLGGQNMRVRSEKNLGPGDSRIDTSLPKDLQQLQQNNRRAQFERSNLVPPADSVTEPVSIHASSPTLDDIASRAAAGEPNAMQLRVDAKGRLIPNTSRVTGAAKNLGAAGLAAASSIAGSALTQGVQAATDVMGMVGTTPTGKDRMQIEKSFNSDMGLGFDLGPDGELVMNPAGREAARKRQQSGINFPSMFQK